MQSSSHRRMYFADSQSKFGIWNLRVKAMRNLEFKTAVAACSLWIALTSTWWGFNHHKTHHFNSMIDDRLKLQKNKQKQSLCHCCSACSVINKQLLRNRTQSRPPLVVPNLWQPERPLIRSLISASVFRCIGQSCLEITSPLSPAALFRTPSSTSDGPRSADDSRKEIAN